MVALPGDEVQRAYPPLQKQLFNDPHHRFLQREGAVGIPVGGAGIVEIDVFDIEVEQQGIAVGKGAGDVEFAIQKALKLSGRMQFGALEKAAVRVGHENRRCRAEGLAAQIFDEPLAHRRIGIEWGHSVRSKKDSCRETTSLLLSRRGHLKRKPPPF